MRPRCYSSVVAPVRSYIIWFTQRVGSTLLTQALEDTGVAGRPREWFNGPLGDGAALRDTLWCEATTTNGVLGVKYGMTPELHAEITVKLQAVTGCADERTAWAAVFPACKHVFMTRRDRVRLAISWWRAIQSQDWHRPTREGTALGVRPPRTAAPIAYDRNAIDHLLREIDEREAAIHDVLRRWDVQPHTMVYEDFIASYEDTVRGVLDLLEIPGARSLPVPAPSFARLADELSEQWYERYVAEHGRP